MRRSPALTAEARRLFAEEVRSTGTWRLFSTIDEIAQTTGLTRDQARDALFSESADDWRRDMYRSLKKEH